MCTIVHMQYVVGHSKHKVVLVKGAFIFKGWFESSLYGMIVSSMMELVTVVEA